MYFYKQRSILDIQGGSKTTTLFKRMKWTAFGFPLTCKLSTSITSPQCTSTSPALGSKVDSLTITYGSQPPILERSGRGAGSGTKTYWHGQLAQPNPALLAEDVIRFRPFWRSFKSSIPELSTLKVCVPPYVSAQWSAWELLDYLPGHGDWREKMRIAEGDRVAVEYLRDEVKR